MPSAARQRLSSELWRSPEPSNKSPVPSYIEIQAHPGYSELLHDESHTKSGNPVLQKLSRRQLTPTARKTNKKNLPRRGSSDDILRDQAELSVRNSNQAISASVSDSECGVSYNTTDCSDFFAVDSVKAPAVNVLPLPPPAWLKSFHKTGDNAHAMKEFSFQAFLGTLVAAESHVLLS